MSIELECVYCKTRFIAKSRRAKYCSKKCHDTVFRLNHGIKCNSNIEPYHKLCVCCGKEFNTFREATTTCSHECALEKERKRKRRDPKYKHTREELLKIQRDQAEIKTLEKKWYQLLHREKRECKICGTFFYCLSKETRVTCSHDCSVEWARLKRNKHTDKRINSENLVDKDISLAKLYLRDKGECYLCGGICDWNDYKINNGIKICGKQYPSIDHVLPLARGGMHQWENVRLAHLGCNIDKGDTTPTFTKEMSREQARKLATERVANKKKTAQYSLDGQLLRIWDSTAQIHRELGLSDKHIQNACRKSQTKTGNAYGFHWEYVS